MNYKILDRFVEVEELKGKVLKEYIINDNKAQLIFKFEDGTTYLMHHCQDCCESVMIEDIVGDLDNLIGSELVMAEEVSNSDNKPLCDYSESWTWTYYKFATIKGYVTIRWYGESNGYYSESVDISQIKFV